MLKKGDRNMLRKRRHLRLRGQVRGEEHRPRLAVFRSLSHIYAQVVDDATGRTIVTASTLDPEVRNEIKGKKKSEASKAVGLVVARRAQSKGISKVVFDRSGYDYHGRVKALADGAREGGLKF
jgi:large subunit ribosomal protein L18